jgi:hypothetical protein
MKNALRIVLFPLACLAASYYICYEIFWWAVVGGFTPWMRKVRPQNPIQDFAELFQSTK